MNTNASRYDIYSSFTKPVASYCLSACSAFAYQHIKLFLSWKYQRFFGFVYEQRRTVCCCLGILVFFVPLKQGWPTRVSRAACGSLPRFMRLFLTCFVFFYQQRGSVIMLHLATSKVHYHVIIVGRITLTAAVEPVV